jgi:methionyl-tRNA formyltransferase
MSAEDSGSRLRLVFFGTAAICLPFLGQLNRRFDIGLIVTQPDAVGGRRRKKIVPAVKSFGLEHHIEVIQPETLKDDTVVDRIRSVEPVLGVVVSYGKLIPKRVFRVPECRTVNVHFSMLPFYRGAAPVQRALEQDDTSTGITIFEIVKKLDAGDIWAQKEMDIQPEDTTQTLWDRMSREGAVFLCDTIEDIVQGRIKKQPQDHDLATFAPIVNKEEGDVDWNHTARRLVNKFRAFTPWPGLCCKVRDKLFKLTRLAVAEETHRRKPGDVLSMDKKRLNVCCGEGTVLEVLELQPQGKKPMTPYCYCLGNELPDCLV